VWESGTGAHAAACVAVRVRCVVTIALSGCLVWRCSTGDLVLLAVGLLLPLPFHKIYVCLVHQHQAVQRAQSPIASKLETILQCWLLILIVFGGNEVVVL
jgi:hypothetical protein